MTIGNMKMLKSLLKQRVSSVLSDFGGVVCRKPVIRGSSLDNALLHGVSNGGGLLSFSNAEILQYGVVRLDGRYCLDLDYGGKAALGSWKRSGIHIPKAIALWSHPWMGYYHWLIDVLPKVCLMQESLGADLGGATLCYPRWFPTLEDESLSLLGLAGSRVIDTPKVGGVSADTVAAYRLPGWYEIPKGTGLFRERLISFAASGMGKRLYISRSGRRRVSNEAEIREFLAGREFTIVEDRPRSLREQISLFYNAEVVVGPHGAALANLLWCRPGSLVVELANESYYPPFYKNLASYCGLRHGAVLTPSGRPHWTRMEDGVIVDLEALKKQLHREGIA